MRWRRALVAWAIIITLFSVFNLLPTLSAPVEAPQTFRDPKTLTYNFTMDQPSFVRDNFTAQVTLDRNPDTYNVRAYVYNWINLSSVSALGEYDYNYSIYINGARVLNGGSYGAGWASAPYQLSAGGPAPDLCCQSQNLTTLHAGVNLFEFRFIQFSKLSKYGTGYYHITIGPFKVDVNGKPVSIIVPLSLEIVVAVILIPVSFLISLASYRIKRKSRPQAPT